jgi:LuxR family transcriptional regulator, maltose regulon positive regulatory protein
MPAPILATKLYIPPPPPKIVVRPRLIDRLNEGLAVGRKLTLISAPAGFGKSTLVSEWLTRCGRSAAWLSLDDNDHDPVRFLIYLTSALQSISSNSGAGILESLQSPQPAPIEAILTALLNEFTAIPTGFILVLDDYHVVDAKAIDEALTFLVDHLPPQMHLVITTREDPALPIPRLRARGQVTELRAADLRFTPAEAAGFLNQVMGFNLSVDDVAALETRTEGWIAGLQLAALSMQGHRDAHAFIRAFSGDHRYIVDYLVEEVLKRQPEPIRNFLLQTAILDRLTGSLCEAVTGQSGGEARLETLQRGNFFIIPLDDQRHWYRYHYLFADVLRMHLISEYPDQVSVLHQRASEWYERNGSVADAIHHALAAKDFDRAAELIERAMPAMRQSRQEATLLGWFQALPDGVFQHRPVLNVHYVGTLLQTGQFDGVESRLRDAERWLAASEDLRDRPVFVDEEDFRRLPGSVAMYHAAIALAQGDVENTMKHARQVLELSRENDDFMRGAASSLLGLASWTSGDLETAHQMYSNGMAHLQRTGFISDVIGGSVTLADIRITQGRLREAMRTYERGLQLATQQGMPAQRGAADMHVGMSELYRERDDVQAATQHLLKSQELGEFNGLPKNPYRWRVVMARIRQVQGDLEGALDLLHEAERLYLSDFSPNVRPIAALRTRVWIAQGRLDEALEWARERKLSIEDPLSYLREFEHITLARLLVVRYKGNHTDQSILDAIGLLERLLKAAEAGGRTGSAIEILILQALAQQLQGHSSSALIPLQQALMLAEPEGYARIFLDEGSSMEQLLREAATRKITPDYTRRLLKAFDEHQNESGESYPSTSPVSQPLIEPLSQRELEVLRLFNTELSGPEIARELVVALSTVRTHTKSIYSKLNVSSRQAAVKRATELGLI